mmetsp:Transcript_118462/g.382463  ORF Transcript_118462/g.382463 Transcript_118462/m.382463 type:complete len:218 (-) Transcript_118462:1928-2581(-)
MRPKSSGFMGTPSRSSSSSLSSAPPRCARRPPLPFGGAAARPRGGAPLGSSSPWRSARRGAAFAGAFTEDPAAGLAAGRSGALAGARAGARVSAFEGAFAGDFEDAFAGAFAESGTGAGAARLPCSSCGVGSPSTSSMYASSPLDSGSPSMSLSISSESGTLRMAGALLMPGTLRGDTGSFEVWSTELPESTTIAESVPIGSFTGVSGRGACRVSQA